MAVIRVVDGVSYWTIEKPYEVRKFILVNIRKEWMQDDETDRIDPASDPWLRALSKLKWAMRRIPIDQVNIDSSRAMTPRFIERLSQRSLELRRAIREYGTVIWPLVLDEGLVVRDGHCRYMTLKSVGITRVLAYVGSSSST